MNTPQLLLRISAYVMLVQALLIVVIAAALPGGASLLVEIGYVTPRYEHNVFAFRLAPVPWTDPTVYLGLQNLAMILSFALFVAAGWTLWRTNPWQHGVLPDSTPPAKPPPAPHSDVPKSSAALPEKAPGPEPEREVKPDPGPGPGPS